MKTLGVVVVLLAVFSWPASAQESCLNPTALSELDASWERAQIEPAADWLSTHLADDFVWIHNNAVRTDTKASLVRIAADPSLENPAASLSRVQSDVEYRILGSTAVVTGFTVTRRARGSSTRFSWMRTYAEVDGRCLLLGNHTMALPDRS